MRVIAWTIALAVTFSVGLNIRATPETIYVTETYVQTETVRHPLTDVARDVLARDVHAPETDETKLYVCWMQLVDLDQIADDEWHPTIRYIDRKWAGDTCQALDHRLEHGWF
jgi:hypothetical protein